MSLLRVIEGESSDYSPNYEPSQVGQAKISVDPSGQLRSRALVLTDEGGYIANFANSSLAVTIGTCTFTNGSDVVTGTSLSSYDLHTGDFIYLTADGVTSAVQIDYFTDTEITLKENYAGAGGTGASSRQALKQKLGAGASIAVSNGVCVITSGTTTGAVTELEREVDLYPLRKRCSVAFSAAPSANSTTYIQLYSEKTTPTNAFARFKFTGTSTTQLTCETGWNPLGSITANETQSSTVFLPGLITSKHEYQIIASFDGVKFFIDRVLVAYHTEVVPHMGDSLTSAIYIENGTTPASYNVTVYMDACKNYNEVDITTNESQTVMTQLAPDRTLPIWAPNSTTPLTIDTQGYSSLRFQIPVAGTASVLTPSWSDDGVNFFTGGGFNPVGGGAFVSTITNATAGGWTIPRLFRWFRLSAASTQTGGVIVSLSNAIGQPVNPTTTVAGSGNFAVTMAASTTTTPAKAEDAAMASGDVGMFCLGVRRDDLSAASLTSATADYSEIAVNRKGALVTIGFEHQVRGYKAVAIFTPAATSTDILDIFGNATTTVEIQRIAIHGIATSANQDIMYLVKRSTANSSGTRVAMTGVPLDSNWAAASSTVGYYSANPTTGTLVGNIGASFVPLSTNATAVETGHEWTFGTEGIPPLRLFGTSQGIAINRNSVAVPAGMSISVEIEWIEYVA